MGNELELSPRTPRSKSFFNRVKGLRRKTSNEEGGTPKSPRARIWKIGESGEERTGRKSGMLRARRSSVLKRHKEDKETRAQTPKTPGTPKSPKTPKTPIGRTWSESPTSVMTKGPDSGRNEDKRRWSGVHWAMGSADKSRSGDKMRKKVSRLGSEWLEVAMAARERERLEEERVRNFDYSEYVTLPEMTDQERLEELFKAASECSHEVEEGISMADVWKSLVDIENTV